MKFGEQLVESMIPEWKSHYVEYERLKRMLEDAEKLEQEVVRFKNASIAAASGHGSQVLELSVLDDATNELVAIDADFNRLLALDIERVESFYEARVKDFSRVLTELSFLAGDIKRSRNRGILSTAKENIHELYRSLDMLKSFASLNDTGICKIAKKHDKVMASQPRILPRTKALLVDTAFSQHKDIQSLQEIVEDVYGTLFCARKESAKKLLWEYFSPRVNAAIRREQTALLTGLAMAFFLAAALSTLSIFVAYVAAGRLAERMFHPAVARLLRMEFTAGLFLLGCGVDVAVWEAKRINYVLIFELQPSKVSSSKGLMLSGFVYMTVYLLCLVMAIESTQREYNALHGASLNMPFGRYWSVVAAAVPTYVWAIAPLLFPLVFFLRAISKQAKISRQLATVIWRNICCWKYRVTFPIFVYGDMMTSVNQFLKDGVTVVTGGYAPAGLAPAILLFPSAIRATQCVKKQRETGQGYPHYFNMVKYLLALPGIYLAFASRSYTGTSSVGAVYFLLVCRVLEITYKTYWDLWEDWALFSGGAGGKLFRANQALDDAAPSYKPNILLRRPSSFSTGTFAIVSMLNVALRYLFLVAPVLRFCGHDQLANAFWFDTLIALGEVVRRVVWNIFRVDNQQATNCEGYVAARFIPMLMTTYERYEMEDRLGVSDAAKQSGAIAQIRLKLHADVDSGKPAVKNVIRTAVQADDGATRHAHQFTDSIENDAQLMTHADFQKARVRSDIMSRLRIQSSSRLRRPGIAPHTAPLFKNTPDLGRTAKTPLLGSHESDGV